MSTVLSFCTSAPSKQTANNRGSNTVKNERPHVPQQLVVHDVTGEEDKYSLDSHGFQFQRHASKVTSLQDFQDDELVKAEYYPESIELLKSV